MIKTTAMLLEELHNYASPASKLSRMTARGECVQIVKGLYERIKAFPVICSRGASMALHIFLSNMR